MRSTRHARVASRPRRLRRAATALTGAAALTLGLTLAPTASADPTPVAAIDPTETVPVQLLSITDLHGYFGDYTTTVPGSHAGEASQKVGGGAYLSTHLKQLRAQAGLPAANSILFSAGDDFSGWPDETEWFWNEPTIEYLNHIGLQFSTLGNHELDRNTTFLRHMMDGSCAGRPDGDLCFTDSKGRPFHGADYDYYSANVIDPATGEPLVEPYHVEHVDDGHGGTIPVGFIHATTSLTTNEALSYWPATQLRFDPEAAAINAAAAELQAHGVQAIVAVVHEGFSQANGAGYNDCDQPFGPMVDINKQITPAVDAIVTGHWHALVNCMLPDPAGNPRPMVEGANHGRLINEIDLQLDPSTGDVLRDRTRSVSHPNTQTVTPDPEVLRMAKYWRDKLPERRARQVASISGDLLRTSDDPEESTIGNATADSFRWAARRDGLQADFGLVTPGTVRRDLPYAPTPGMPGDGPGRVTFGEAMFGLVYEDGIGPAVVTASLTGEQIDGILESQWQQAPDGTVTFTPLALSSDVSYRYDPTAPVGEKVSYGQVRVGGMPLQPHRTYRVAMLSTLLVARYAKAPFLGLMDATDPRRTNYSGPDAFVGYLTAHSPYAPPPLDRVAAKPID